MVAPIHPAEPRSPVSFTEVVQRGMQWLDDHGPAGWLARIDVGTLSVDSTARCVLAQAFQAPFGAVGLITGLTRDTAIAHGFALNCSCPICGTYEALTAEWVRAILARRAALQEKAA
jgi:hypothetical protein